MRTRGVVRRLVALPGIVIAGVLAGPAVALPPAVDGDGDGYLDGIETPLGSNPADAGSTPESVSNPPSCLDGLDNDGDTLADVDDPGCNVPVPVEGTFPPAGIDAFDSHMTLDGYALVTPFGTCSVDFDAHGPTVIMRGDPYDLGGGHRGIDVEMIAMQLSGIATINAGGDCTLPAGDMDVTVFEKTTQQSLGMVTDQNPDPSADFPALSFFDVYFDVDVGGAVIEGGPPGGAPGAPVHVANDIKSLPPYHNAKNPNCYEVQGLEHDHCPKSPPDHYKCYAAKFPKLQKLTVGLRDQFGDAQAKVLKPLYLCTPSTKGAEPLYDEASHLACYALKPAKAKHKVVVHNQFGTGDVTTKKRTMLCLPTVKNGEGDPLELDHFACYTAKFPRIEPRPVTLVDQFKTEDNQASKAVVLCNPVSKNGTPIRNPLEHLIFYKLKPQAESRTVTYSNQFGSGEVKIKKSALLGVPTGKFDAEATTTTTMPVTTTTQPGGRALVPLTPFQGVPAGNICLADIEPSPDGCVEPPDQCPNVHVHRTISIHVGQQVLGPFIDTFVNPCGHGSVVTNEPGCPPDDFPACMH
jgi:hypothetical protein